MIRIFEVGPRDGLQNEQRTLTVDQRLDLIEDLLGAGLRDIEVGAFVRTDRIPQMADTDKIFMSPRFHGLQQRYPDATFWALVPNDRGLDRALECGARAIAVFGGATETFVEKNIGMSIADSLRVFSGVVQKALQAKLAVRGYISVCWVCPYEGDVKPEAVLAVVQPMLEMLIPEISLGDTVGKAHPVRTEALLTLLLKAAPANRFAVHFHDTYGMALANIDRSLKLGIETVDASVGGLGGCPYAPGASGNVATEDVCTLLDGYRETKNVQSLDLVRLLQTAQKAQEFVGHPLFSRRLRTFGSG